jgi:hypothetical protein
MEKASRAVWKARASGGVRRLVAPALVAALALALVPTAAHAVTVPTVDLPSSLLANATATYSAHATTTQNNERVTTIVYTFPLNTDLSGVSAATVSAREQPGSIPYPITGVTVNQATGMVTVNITFPKDKPTETFDVNVGGVVNGSQPGAGYSYTVAMTSDRPGASSSGARAYTLTANATAVNVGAVTLSSSQPLTASTYTVPVGLGARGRLSGTTAVGANTIVVTFPAGTTVPAAPPSGSVTIDGTAAGAIAVSGQQVTLTLAAAQTLAGGSTFDVVFGAAFALVNPPAGTHSLTVQTSAESGTGTSPGYVIAPTPYLTMTIDAVSVDFGAVDPGVTSAAQAVNVTVDSSAGFTISRVLSGDVALLGLVVAGAAEGAKGAGLATYPDSYTITPPWTTTPDVALNAQVQYTAVQ